jgi:putative FmdB family regulatory protein
MPLYTWKCTDCGNTTEDIVSVENRYNPCECEHCQSMNTTRKLDIYANTPRRYGDSHGYYNRGLGCWIDNAQQEEKILKDRGLHHWADYGDNAEMYCLEDEINEWQEHDERTKQIQELKEQGMSDDNAYAEVFDEKYIEEKYDLDTPVEAPIQKL